MSIDRVTSGSNNIIQRYNLDPMYDGFTEYNLHCTNWFIWCHAKDMHFEKIMIRINDNPNEVLYGLSEDCTIFPPVQDIRKTLGHELFHAIGIDHNSGDTSIVSESGYVTGATNGYNPNTTDIADLVARYQ